MTAHPSAGWIARQLTEACGWSELPRYIIRDRDGAYGDAFIRRNSPQQRDEQAQAARTMMGGLPETTLLNSSRDGHG